MTLLERQYYFLNYDNRGGAASSAAVLVYFLLLTGRVHEGDVIPFVKRPKGAGEQ